MENVSILFLFGAHISYVCYAQYLVAAFPMVIFYFTTHFPIVYLLSSIYYDVTELQKKFVHQNVCFFYFLLIFIFESENWSVDFIIYFYLFELPTLLLESTIHSSCERAKLLTGVWNPLIASAKWARWLPAHCHSVWDHSDSQAMWAGSSRAVLCTGGQGSRPMKDTV